MDVISYICIANFKRGGNTINSAWLYENIKDIHSGIHPVL